jgi:hypothetical protein
MCLAELITELLAAELIRDLLEFERNTNWRIGRD